MSLIYHQVFLTRMFRMSTWLCLQYVLNEAELQI